MFRLFGYFRLFPILAFLAQSENFLSKKQEVASLFHEADKKRAFLPFFVSLRVSSWMSPFLEVNILSGHNAAALSEADPSEAFAFTIAAKDRFITIF